MKLSLPSRLLREALTDAPSGDYIDRLLEKMNSDAEQTNQALTQNLTFADNMNAAIVKYDLTHGSEKSIPNPLKTRPVGIYAVRSAAINGGTRYAIDSLGWRFVDSGDPKQPQQIGVTASYAHPPGVCSLYRAAAYDVPDNTDTPLPFDTTSFVGGALSYNTAGSRIVCASAGIVSASYSVHFNTSLVGSRQAFFTRNGSTATDIWGRESEAGTAAATGLSGSALISVSAGDYLQLSLFQNSGAPLALTLSLNRVRMDAHYVAPPFTAQNTVTLLIIGG